MLWLSLMCMLVMWSPNLLLRESKTLMISSSANNLDTTGSQNLMIALSNKPILHSNMATNISETALDLSSLLSLISAISPWLQLSIFNLVATLPALQEQAKHRLLRILLKLWLCNVWCSTVLMVLTLELWVVSSVAWPKEEPGLVSMSSIVLISKCCLW